MAQDSLHCYCPHSRHLYHHLPHHHHPPFVSHCLRHHHLCGDYLRCRHPYYCRSCQRVHGDAICSIVIYGVVFHTTILHPTIILYGVIICATIISGVVMCGVVVHATWISRCLTLFTLTYPPVIYFTKMRKYLWNHTCFYRKSGVLAMQPG